MRRLPTAEPNPFWPGRQYTKPFGGLQVTRCAKVTAYPAAVCASKQHIARHAPMLPNGPHSLIESNSPKEFPAD
jgi:hypothetical protein